MLRGDTAYDQASARWVAKEKCVMLVRDHLSRDSGCGSTLTPWLPGSAHLASRRSRRRPARPRGASAPPERRARVIKPKRRAPQLVEAGAISRYGRAAGWEARRPAAWRARRAIGSFEGYAAMSSLKSPD
jgi:hypothetical protein